MAKSPKQDDKRDDIQIDEAARRKGDAALLRALHTPPRPHGSKSMSPLRNGDCFLVVDGKMRVAHVIERGHRSITADVFRNLDDYRAGRAMERAATFAV